MPVNVDFAGIPYELKEIPKWILWKHETQDGTLTKVPYNPKGAGKASVTDPKTWSDFTLCKNRIDLEPDAFAGVGFILSLDDGFVCVDLDNKTSETDKLPEYTELAHKFGSFAEISASGRGVHIWCKGKKPGNQCRRGDVEIYENARFIAVTGHRIEGTPKEIRPAQAAIDELYTTIVGTVSDTTPNESPTATGSLSDDEIIKLADTHNPSFSTLFGGETVGYKSASEADAALVMILAFYTDDPFQIDSIFRRSGLYREKWDREDYRIRTITSAFQKQGGSKYDPKPLGYVTYPRAKKPQKPKEETSTPSEPPKPSAHEPEAMRIIQEGRVLEQFRSTYKTLHSGDLAMCDVITLASACGSCLTSQGIHPGFSGAKGTGKTSGTRAALHLWPNEYIVDGGMSNKALFYDDSLKPGCVIFSDDTYLNEEMQQTVKVAMSSFQQGAAYLTVGRGPTGGNTGIKKRIPARTTFIYTSIDDTGDQELSDRQYKISLSPDIEQKKARLQFLQDRMAAGREELPLSDDVLVCREILRKIKSKMFRVVIPFAAELQFTDLDAIRDAEQFFDFVQAVAILNYPNRSPVEENMVTTISATEADFHTAQAIFKTSDDTRRFKITKNERALVNWLCDQTPERGISESEIAAAFGKRYKISRGTVRRLLYGKDGQGGLCNKVPGIYLQKEQRINDTNYDSKAFVNVVYCDPALKTGLGDFEAFVTLGPATHATTTPTDPEPTKPVEAAPVKIQPQQEPQAIEPPREETKPMWTGRPKTPPCEVASEFKSLEEWADHHQTGPLPDPDKYKYLDGKAGACRCKCTGCENTPLRADNGNFPLCQKHYKEYVTLWEREHGEPCETRGLTHDLQSCILGPIETV